MNSFVWFFVQDKHGNTALHLASMLGKKGELKKASKVGEFAQIFTGFRMRLSPVKEQRDGECEEREWLDTVGRGHFTRRPSNNRINSKKAEGTNEGIDNEATAVFEFGAESNRRLLSGAEMGVQLVGAAFVEDSAQRHLQNLQTGKQNSSRLDAHRLQRNALAAR